MEHVLVLSDDIELTRDFYCRVVGLTVGARPSLEFPGYWLYAGSTPCLHIAERAAYRDHAAHLGLRVSGKSSGPGAIDHISFSASDYGSLTERFEREGVAAIRNAVPGGGPRQLFIEDPNGVRVEINVKASTNEAGGG
jgi:catechol 2,3-dioxygenase-like lactoylglutathione lyase family enzyme